VTNVIHLGYEVGTGEPVEIPLRHTAVTGQTQESGKTTTLEGLIHRSNLRAIAYVTKRGESSFHVMNPIAPYFQERADWKFVQSLLEASTDTKLKFEQSWIMRASEGAKTLADVRANIQKFLHGVRDTRPVKHKRGAEVKERWLQKPARGLSGDIYYILDKYLDDVMPQLAGMPYVTRLELAQGLNVMDLREYEFPLQALVVRSVIDWIRGHGENIITVIPEAWKFAPKQKGSPVRQSAEELIREGGALKNFLWIDSQDLAGVADVLMRQVGVWIFGVQRAKHEIERALDHMPEGLPARRPRPADIATLTKGQFYVCFAREMYKVYVQPAWMTAAHAEAIARGEEDVNSAHDILKEFDKENVSRVVDEAPRNAAVKQKKADGVPGGYADGDLLQVHDKEDEMWKEKYEALKAEFDKLKAVYDKSYIPLRGAPGEPEYQAITGDMAEWFSKFPADSFEAIYRYVRKRMHEDPGILEMLAQHPEIRVKTERPVMNVEANGSLFGRICQLTAEGFFKQPQGAKAATAEAVRRGWCHPKTPVMRIADPLDELAKMGFLTRETDGYQIVAGVKINLEG
jgi:hypothetical protein